jgi:hypothetical protein
MHYKRHGHQTFRVTAIIDGKSGYVNGNRRETLTQGSWRAAALSAKTGILF